MNLIKRRGNWIHFQKRIWERYHIHINTEEYEKAISLIQSTGREKYFVEKRSNSKKIYRIPIKGSMVTVVYCNTQHNLVTALPK